MSFLLDTHALAWALFNPDELSSRVRDLLSADDEIFFSPISLFEIETKATIGKWPNALPPDWAPALRQFGAVELQIDWRHAAAAGRLPLHHRDPWDRLLIAQAVSEGLIVVTLDPMFARYDIRTFW